MIRSKDASRVARSPILRSFAGSGYLGKDGLATVRGVTSGFLPAANLTDWEEPSSSACVAATPVAQRLNELRGPRSNVVRRIAI